MDLYNSAYGSIVELVVSGKGPLDGRTADKLVALSLATDAYVIHVVYIMDANNMGTNTFELTYKNFLTRLLAQSPDQFIADTLANPPADMDFQFWRKVYEYILKAYKLDRCRLEMKPPELLPAVPISQQLTDNQMEVQDSLMHGAIVHTKSLYHLDHETKFDPVDDLSPTRGGGAYIPDKPSVFTNPRSEQVPSTLHNAGIITAPIPVAHFVKNGDMIVGSDFIMIGRDTFFGIKVAGVPPPLDEDAFIAGFRNDYQVPGTIQVLPFGPAGYDSVFFKAYYHLDLYLMYMGESAGKHQFFIGKINEEMVKMNKDEEGGDEASTVACQAMLEDIYIKMKAYYEIKMPGRCHFTQVSMLHFGRYAYPYQNGLVEIRPDHTRYVIIPSYFKHREYMSALGINECAFSQLSLLAIVYRAAFKAEAEKLGFTVRDAGDYTDSLADAGALHCSTGILARQEH